MDVLLIRHSEAAPAGPTTDAERALTPRGLALAAGLAQALRRAGLLADRLYHSPLRRAQQTAEQLAPAVHGDVVGYDPLADPPDEALFKILTGERVALVGHQPFMGELGSWLVWGDRRQGERLAVEPAGLLWLTGAPKPGGMVLRALLAPELVVPSPHRE